MTDRSCPELKIVTERPRIEKGITRDELHNFYWRLELIDFLKSKGVRPKRSRSDIIDQIILMFSD